MPAKLLVGLSRKQGLPHYGSVGASCSLEIELPSDILSGAGTPLQRQAEMAFDACRLSVDAELNRHVCEMRNEPSSPAELESPSASAVRLATPRQLRAIERLILKMGANPCDWIGERMGPRPLHSLSVAEASELIDELHGSSLPSRQSASRQLAG